MREKGMKRGLDCEEEKKEKEIHRQSVNDSLESFSTLGMIWQLNCNFEWKCWTIKGGKVAILEVMKAGKGCTGKGTTNEWLT